MSKKYYPTRSRKNKNNYPSNRNGNSGVIAGGDINGSKTINLSLNINYQVNCGG